MPVTAANVQIGLSVLLRSGFRRLVSRIEVIDIQDKGHGDGWEGKCSRRVERATALSSCMQLIDTISFLVDTSPSTTTAIFITPYRQPTTGRV